MNNKSLKDVTSQKIILVFTNLKLSITLGRLQNFGCKLVRAETTLDPSVYLGG
jgi:hypothetical protein